MIFVNTTLYCFIFFLSICLLLFVFLDLRKGNTQCFLFVFPAFFIFYILPVLLKPFFGIPDYGVFQGANFAFDDENAIFWYLFTIFCFLSIFGMYYYFNRKNDKVINSLFKDSTQDKTSQLINSKFVINGIALFSFFPTLWFIVNPRYWNQLLYASTIGSSDNTFPGVLVLFGILSSCIFIVMSKKKNLLIWVECFNVLFLSYINGNRASLFSSVIFVAYALILSKKINPKVIINVLIVFVPILIIFALTYQNIIKPVQQDFYTYMSIDFSRDYTSIYAFHCENNDNMILNYRGETFLSSLLFFIPRVIFPDKPFPFAQYITVSLFGGDKALIGHLGWGTTTSLLSESIANFSYWGIFVFLIIMFILMRIADTREKLEWKFIFIYVSFIILTLEFQAFAVALSCLILEILLLNWINKIYINNSNNKDLRSWVGRNHHDT